MDGDNKDVNIEHKKAVVTNQLAKKNNGTSISSLVWGIISLGLCWAFIISIITGIVGIIYGIISIAKKRDGFNIAFAGILASLIGLLISFFLSALSIAALLLK
ncbi:hypothetical protein [Clostridium saccharobutylicum]|uniref:DUF4190 domain-containing protein n=1 Tax=Clostridium saccharobutylicum DSM 13864 TaxID=1345695 RepID=U5MYE7_CLOSA|nr:hypothetical protein [Clostridium saccharobutylicum]AGX44487.1 hypothetical protein CLSA_c35260 [Clostridium saccharobutylicum DSM 13864]AQR91781.1 hypothetical protein CLOSC_35090 [Clostridium saccharobutylicum]AQS01683.1 hypothetical protein CSACC_35140 [Clostridium saccharobutylicum]AQS15666.1 hypothetical protein CLOSACC_35140 [Clostridium saccharobutylicum]MBA2907443.1 putative membrane protein [Clostridium saccharobutylicum]